MSKVIKTVVSVAAVAAAVYYGGGALLAAGGKAAAAGAAATAGGFSGSTLLAAGGLALQGASFLGQQGAAEDMQNAENARVAAQEKMNESQQRQSDVEAQRQRVAQVREERIKRASVIASTGQGGMGIAGTSSVQGSVGSLNTQMGANIGYINQQQGFAAEQSGYNKQIGAASSSIFSAQNAQTGWSSVGSLGKTLFTEGDGFKSIFKATNSSGGSRKGSTVPYDANIG